MGLNTARIFQWTFAVLVLTVVVGYNGCGESGFNAVYMTDLSSISGVKSQCDAQLMQTYSTTYFPLLSTNCNRCHSDSQGSTDLATSYQTFMQKGATLINYQATHPHSDNGIDLTTQIAAIQPTWTTANSSYMTCLASTPVDPGGSNGSAQSLKLVSKVIPNITNTIAKNGTFVSVQWDVSTEDAAASQNGQFNAIFTVDVRYSLQSGVPVGLEFKNPRMHLKATGTAITLDGLNLYLDGVYQDRVTTWLSLSGVSVGSTTDVSLAPGTANALAYYPQVSAGTMVSFEFENIGLVGATTTTTTTTMPAGGGSGTAVTFTQLISTDPTLGVLKNSCLSCHSGPTPASGVDLSNYTVAVSKASDIQSRMNNAGSPMPPSGLVPQAERDVVNRWISGGTPQ